MAVLPVLQPVVWTLMPATTVGRAVNAATQRLEEAGVSTSRLDAQVILAHVLNVSRSWLFAHYEQTLDATQADQYTELIARRMRREPVAYIVGRKEFYGIDLRVDNRVLIPRPETEMLVDAVLDIVLDSVSASASANAPEVVRIADVGTGSGAIAVAVAANAANTEIFAIDLSDDALAVAHENVRQHDTRNQITLLQGDLLGSLPGRVDVVVANLPYVNSTDYRTLEADVRVYEPPLALVSGEQGLDAITRLIEQLPAHLNPGGSAILEIGYDQGPAVLALVATLLPQAEDVRVHRDVQGHDRMVSFCL